MSKVLLAEPGAVPVLPYVVVNEWNRPIRGFDTAEEAVEWARDNEPIYGWWEAYEAHDPIIKFSWRAA